MKLNSFISLNNSINSPAFLYFAGRKPVSISKKELEDVIESNPQYTLNQIGEAFQVSGVTIKKLIEKYGITCYKLKINTPSQCISKDNLENIIRKNPQYTQDVIGNHYGVTGATIGNWINNYNINIYKNKSHNQPVTITKEALEEFIKENPKCTQEKIAQHFQVSIPTISRRIKKFNLDYKK